MGGELLRQVGSELYLRVKACPNAGSSVVEGVRSGELLVRLRAQPEKGKANHELLVLLARALDLPRSSLRVVRGESARHKVVALPLSAGPRVLGMAVFEPPTGGGR
jgi:hypothetical protein